MLPRIVIDAVGPATPSGGHPAKVVAGRAFTVSADIWKDGHDTLAARLTTSEGATTPMVLVDNDRWEGDVTLGAPGRHHVVIEAWPDRMATWRRDLKTKVAADQDVANELHEGTVLLLALAPAVPKLHRSLVKGAAGALADDSLTLEERLNAGLDDAVAAAIEGLPLEGEITVSPPLELWVDRERAETGAWYELFPRSEGGLLGAAKRLPDIARMGFDIVYLSPIHPIGHSARKGRNNSLEAGPDDVGSPWAIGSEDGGHTTVHSELGTIEDFDTFVAEAESLGMEVALDYALQCSPDHPWVKEHPEWFHHRPDGTIKYAENPPKKYQDIYPVNFWPAEDKDRLALWEVCKEILDFWIGHGVKVFRVDNPHTKPIVFWTWLIRTVQSQHPDVIFLAEAFTRPKVMAKLAEVGFSQSYTYFTWRTEKAELAQYVTDLSTGPTSSYMRPNFWPNTPDILAEPLRHGSLAAFRMRLLLAATLVPSYGIYSGYELGENEPQSDASEEYLFSEKYELKERDWDQPGSLAPFITRLNQIRRAHPALQRLGGTTFHSSQKDALLVYSRATADLSDLVLCVVNLDPLHWQEDTLWVDVGLLGLPWDEPFIAHDELSGSTFIWQGGHAYVRLDPDITPGHVLYLRAR